MSGLEVALIPGVLALGESIACQLGYAAAESQLNTGRSSTGSNTGRSHPGIYSGNSTYVNPPRSHCGIYCNSGPKRNLPSVAEAYPVSDCQSYHSEVSGSSGLDYPHSLPLSARSVCESEMESPCPTARLVQNDASSTKQVTMRFPMPPEIDCDGHSPSTKCLLMPPQERLCPPRSGSPFGMASPTHECLATTPDAPASLKISAGCGYLFTLSDLANLKRGDGASNSTSSTCSDLDISARTVSSNVSNTSEQQSPESVCSDEVEVGSPRGSRTGVPAGASPVDQTVSKARAFCRQAFADCDLDHLDEEMADLTKDLEALRASMASSKRVLNA